MGQTDVRWLALLLVAGSLTLYAGHLRWATFRRRSRARRRQRRATEGERCAEALLRKCRYRVLTAQAEAEWTVVRDRAPLVVKLRADYLVAHAGKMYVAEVKTGSVATSLRTGATRRQLLEYALAFDVDGVLLVDADAQTVQRVRFPAAERRRPQHAVWTGLAVGVASAAIASLLFL